MQSMLMVCMERGFYYPGLVSICSFPNKKNKKKKNYDGAI